MKQMEFGIIYHLLARSFKNSFSLSIFRDLDFVAKFVFEKRATTETMNWCIE